MDTATATATRDRGVTSKRHGGSKVEVLWIYQEQSLPNIREVLAG